MPRLVEGSLGGRNVVLLAGVLCRKLLQICTSDFKKCEISNELETSQVCLGW